MGSERPYPDVPDPAIRIRPLTAGYYWHSPRSLQQVSKSCSSLWHVV